MDCRGGIDFPGQRKISKNRAEQGGTGGGSADVQILIDLEERAAALVGSHSRSTTCAGPEDLKAQREAAPRTPVLLQVVIPMGPEKTTEEEEDDHLSSVVHASTSSSTDEVAGPSSLQQATPRRTVPTPTPRRLSWRGRQALRLADPNEDMVALSRASSDIGRELLQAIGGLIGNIAAIRT